MAVHRHYKLAVIAGDGIGTEVTPAAMAVVDAMASRHGFSVSATAHPWSCAYYRAEGRMMPADGLERLRGADAIFLGAIGAPGVPDHVSVWELILPIRQRFEQYVNLRPMRLLAGVPGPLRDRTPQDIDWVCVRENSEGEYAGLGGRLHRGTPHEVAEQTGLFTRRGIERVVRYACNLAMSRPRHLLASATKSNALQHSMVLWDEVVDEVARDFPALEVRKYHVDALAARMVTHPRTLDVMVASNLFGDILTDLGGALQGSLGLPASANIDPSGRNPSMFEPVHGSAPGRAGKGTANPMAAIWAAAMMLETVGQAEAAGLVMRALETVARQGPKTVDLGGAAGTRDVGAAVEAVILGT